MKVRIQVRSVLHVSASAMLVASIVAGASWSQNRPFDPGGDEAAQPLPRPQDTNQAPPQPDASPQSPLVPVAFHARVTSGASARPGPLVLGEIRWSCSGGRCDAQAPAHLFGVPPCTELARAVGPVTFFGAGQVSLSAADLQACNAASASRPHPGIDPTSGGLGSRRVSPKPAAPVSVERLLGAARDFRQRAAKMPASSYTTSCPYPFASGRLDAYLEASGRGDVQAARAEIWRMDTQLGCMSAARFAALESIFRETLLGVATGEDARTLAPVVLLFTDYGGGAFRAEFLAWLREHAADLIAALQNQQSWLSRVGLLLRDRDGSLVRVSGEPAWHQMELASAGGLDSGRCTLIELTLLEDGDGDGRSAVFCPKDCQEILADDERTEGLLAGTPPPEVQQECERRRQEKERVNAARRRSIGDCIEQFNANSPSMVACVADGLTGYRRTRLAIGRPERTREDIFAKRRCMVGQGKADLTQYLFARQNLEYANRRLDSLYANRDRLIRQMRAVFDPDFEPGPVDFDGTDGPIASDCPRCEDEADVENHHRLMSAFSNNENRIVEMTRAKRDAEERLRVESLRINPVRYYRLPGANDCAADGTGCPDSCGIEDALAELTGACVDEATGTPAPDKPGAGGPSNPNVAKPSPLGPGRLPGTVSGLQECLAAATGSSRPLGDPACYDTTCPDAKVAKVDPERPGECRCVDPDDPGMGEGSAPDYCPGYVDCPEDSGSACECVVLRDPGESLGQGGEGPGPRPGLGPEGGPFRIPLF